jgi:protein involved in polysaccharide export with SLBB domain
MEVVDPDKKLAAGDQVTVEILEDREGGLPRVVTATGELDVPPLGRVKVAGKTTAEASRVIKKLLEDDYYHTATVRLAIDRVSPVAVKTGTVSISGEVKQVGEIPLISGETLTLSSAVLRAGGWGTYANQRKVQLARVVNGQSVIKIYDVKEILKKGDAKLDPVLQDGDRIMVPRLGFVM